MEIRNRNILVTGGAGFIGSHLVDEFATENHVIILDDFSSGNRENIVHHEGKKNVNIVTGDVRNQNLLFEIMKDVDIVYHLAVRCLRESIKKPEITHEVNATGTLNLLKASLKNTVQRFIYVSSSEVYGTARHVPMDEMHPCEPITVYGASKLCGELYALAYQKTYGLPSLVIRPFNTYGPREQLQGVYGEVIPRFVLRLLNGKPPVIFGDGSQTRDFTYVSDTVRGIILASQCDSLIGQTINIARGQEVSIHDLALIISDKLGKNSLRPVYEQKRPGDLLRHYADISKARTLLGFQPGIDIEQGISKYIDWFLSQNYNISELSKQESVFNW
jgi:UDP-glucose 4-epimerase